MVWSRFDQRIVFGIATFGWILSTIETSLFPACLPDMVASFQVSDKEIQGVIFYAFLGMASTSLVYGFLSDTVGRKKVLFYAGFLFFISSLASIFAKNFSLFLVCRFFQGCFSAAPFCLGAALLHDVYDKKNACIQLSYVAAIYSAALAVGVPLGAFLSQTFSWEANLWLLAILGGLYTLTVFFYLPETRDFSLKKVPSLKNIVQDYWRGFSNFQIIVASSSMGILFEILSALFVSLPLIYIVYWGRDQNAVAWGLFFIVVGMIAARFSARVIMDRISPDKLVLIGLIGSAASITGLLVIGFSGGYLFFLSLFCSLAHAVFARASAPGFIFLINEVYPGQSGVVNAIYTFVRLLLGFLVLKGSAFFFDGTLTTLAAFLLFLHIIPLFLHILLMKKRAAQALSSR